MKFIDGISLLKIAVERVAICFFNSLNDILNNQKDLKYKLVSSLSSKRNFAIVCNFTRGGNHTLAWNEECFLNDCCKELKKHFLMKRIDILGGEGIIILGDKK